MTSQELADARLLDMALDDMIHSRCANCRKQARINTTLCDHCWTIAAEQQILTLVLAHTPLTRPN